MRTASWLAILFALACATATTVGPLDGGSANYPSIMAVDSALPPTSVSVQIDRDAYIVVLLVAPGHSATLLYPSDSVTDNHLTGGSHTLSFVIPAPLVRIDSTSAQRNDRSRQRIDSVSRSSRRNRSAGNSLPPIQPSAPKYLLVITSPQQLSYARVIDKTAGVSFPLGEAEALSAVGKAIKSTLEREPREWAGYYQLITLSQPN